MTSRTSREPLRLRPYQVDEFRRLLASGVDYRTAAAQAVAFPKPGLSPTRALPPSDARPVDRGTVPPAPSALLLFLQAIGALALAWALTVLWFSL